MYVGICLCLCGCACVHHITNGGDVHLKQSMQLVHVPLSNWHNAVLGTQLVNVCYCSITHFSAPPSQGGHVSPALDRLPALPLQVWLTELEQDGSPTPTSPS